MSRPKHRVIHLIRELGELETLDSVFNSRFDLSELTDVESRLGDQARRGPYHWALLVFAFLLTLWAATLITLYAVGLAPYLSNTTVTALAAETVFAVIGAMVSAMKRYS